MKPIKMALLAFVALALAACAGSSQPTQVAPVIASLSAAPSPVTAGVATSVTWTWAYSNSPTPAPTCSIDNGVGPVTNGDSTRITLPGDTTFTLSCANAAGVGTAQTAIGVVSAPVLGTFTASPSAVTIGAATAVTWSWTFSNAPSPAPDCAIDNAVGPVTSGSSTSVTLAADTVFTLTCSNSFGSGSRQVSVSAVRAPVLASFSASPSTVTANVPTSVTWAWSYSAVPVPNVTCSIDNGVGPVTIGASSGVTLASGVAVAFTVSCTNSAGSDTARATVSACPLGYAAPACSTCAPGYQDNDSNGTCLPTCATSPLFCGSHEICSDASGTATCVCRTGYTGAGCQACDVGFHACSDGCCPTMALLALGAAHTCAATSSGAVKCWGSNEYGQLGRATGVLSNPQPVDVVGLADGAAALAAGYGHTCVVTTPGGAWCWGYNGYDELGSGQPPSMSVATLAVSGLPGGAQALVACGAFHACVVASSGGVNCWGWNGDGQLGDDTTCPNGTSTCYGATPVAAAGLAGVTSLGAGGHGTSYPGGHSCAVAANGVSCWGDNRFGQIGDGTLTNRRAPTGVSGLASGAQSVAGGAWHTCAITTGGGVKCWGRNSTGQLGDGTTTDRSTPVDVQGLTTGMVSVAPGGGHTCALTTGGGVKCWGANGAGQLGDGTTTSRTTAADVAGLTSGVAAIASGLDHTCALTTSGDVKCWGYNERGKVGVPITNCAGFACPVTMPSDVAFY